MRIQMVRVVVRDLRARSALAAAVQGDASRNWLRLARRETKQLARENLPAAHALSLLVRAGIAAFRRQTNEAASLLEQAITALDAADMALHAASARRRLGQLLGGDEGRALVDKAETWMVGQGIRNPERMTNLFVPGGDR